MSDEEGSLDETLLDQPKYKTDQVASTHVFEGNVRRDYFGRFVIDTCVSDDDHLLNAQPKPGDDRARCRRLLDESFESLEGLKGRVVVTVEFQAEEEPV